MTSSGGIRRARAAKSGRARTGARSECAPGAPSSSRAGIRRPQGVGTMTLRRRMPAALFGAALITLALAAMGGNSGTNFGDPLPGLTPDLQARFTAGQASFVTVETVPDGIGPVFNDTACG